jgi:hypothetical protein
MLTYPPFKLNGLDTTGPWLNFQVIYFNLFPAVINQINDPKFKLSKP